MSGCFRRFGSSQILSENFMRSVIKWGLKLVMMPNVNRPNVEDGRTDALALGGDTAQ
jgi:hypothetical protein